MQPLVTTNLVALTLLVVLVLSGSVGFLRGVLAVYGKRRRFVVFEIPENKEKDIRDILNRVSPPFTFEVAVGQLGKARRYYLTLPAGRMGRAVGSLGARRGEDYDFY